MAMAEIKESQGKSKRIEESQLYIKEDHRESRQTKESRGNISESQWKFEEVFKIYIKFSKLGKSYKNVSFTADFFILRDQGREEENISLYFCSVHSF